MGRKPKGERPMTNAERQRAYRQRRSGGPQLTVAQIAKVHGCGRTGVFYASYVTKHRPDLVAQVQAGTLAITRAYRIAREGMTETEAASNG